MCPDISITRIADSGGVDPDLTLEKHPESDLILIYFSFSLDLDFYIKDIINKSRERQRKPMQKKKILREP